MTSEQFLAQARSQISADPSSRLTPLAKKVIDNPNGIIDVHTHIFDRKCLKIGYILLRMGKSLALGSLGLEALESDLESMRLMNRTEEEVYKSIGQLEEDKEEDWDQLDKEIDTTIEINDTFELFGFDLKETKKVLQKKNMLEILDLYDNAFCITRLPQFADAEMAVVVLQMDLETGWDFTPKRNFKQQIRDLKEISQIRPILPYIALDPRRADRTEKEENLYELFLDVFTDPKAPFFGVKCYPALGYFPSDVRLDPIFQICEEKNIPILSHCGGTIVSTTAETISVKNQEGYLDFKIPGKDRKERANFLNEPGHWDSVLAKYPKLKLNFGHFGGEGNWLEKTEKKSNERVDKIISMMKSPNGRVYADFSFNVIEPDTFDGLKEFLDIDSTIAARTLYGTDYWVVLPSGNLMETQKLFFEKLKDHQQALLRDNILDYLLK